MDVPERGRGIAEREGREGRWGNSKGAGEEAPVPAWGLLLPAHAREQRPARGRWAEAAVPSAPTVNLNVIIDVSVPVRKKTGCCEQSGLPRPHHLPTPRQGPAPAAASVPCLLTCLRTLVSATQPRLPPPSLVLSPQRWDPLAWGEHGSGPSCIVHGWWPCPRLPGAADPAVRRDSTGPLRRATGSI